MPIYTYECPACHRREESVRSIDRRHNGPACHGPMALKILPTHVIGDIEPYRNVIDGKIIRSRKHHREFLDRHGVVEVGNG